MILGFSLALTLTIFSFRRWHETRQLASQLNSLAIHDKLTGLFNRQMIEQLIQAEQNRLQRSRQPYSLILLDIDHFKRINDLYGHLEGDTLLQQIANLLQKHTRTPDMIGRWGGEEFLILLPETDKRAAHNLAERLRTILAAQAFRCGEQVTASLGIATAVTPECYSTLFLRLDNALYLAKHNGRNRCQMSPESGDDDLLQAVFATKKKPQLKQSGS